MRCWLIATSAGLFATSALAQDAVISSATFHQRMNSCVISWKEMLSADRGTMTYRQYTTKCVSGKPAKPARSSALCRNGMIEPGTEAGGACASRGGVADWLN